MKSTKRVIPLLLLLIVIITACKDNKNLTLTKGDTALFTIVAETSKDTLIAKATGELQHYIEHATGAQISISKEISEEGSNIIIEEDSDLGNNTVAIKVEGDNLYIKGSNSQYTLFAVYEFLEQQMGCRFFAHDCEAIPHTDKIVVPRDLNYSYSPKIGVRTVHSKLLYNNYNFAEKLRTTHEGFPFYAKGAGVHTFHRFLPADIYFEDHPEYYALIDGQRRATQPCLSNPEVLDIVISEVAKLFEEQPEATVVSVSSDDNTQYCRCDKCAAIDKEEGAPSGSIIRFVNRVAEKFPDKTISTLAYQYTREACITKPLDNVMITLCSIECDRSAPIDDKCRDFASDLKEWKKLTENIRIWDYTTQFTNFLAPFPNIETLKPNLQLFADNNATWVFEQHSHNDSELFELRTYLTARLLWNPERDAQHIIEEFSNGYYEEAGSYIVDYITRVHDELKKDPSFFLFLYGGPAQGFNSFLSPENLEIYNSNFDMAEKAVANKPEILKRVEKARLGVRYATLEACRANLTDKYTFKNSDWVKSEFNNFKRVCKEWDIKLMNETKFYVDDYTSMYQRNMDRMSSNNIANGKPVTLLTKPKKYAGEDPQALTDGVPGAGSFDSNWLGFEGEDMVAIVDLERAQEISQISTVFLQVVNHVVTLPTRVIYSISTDGKSYKKVGVVECGKPLTKESKINDTFDFALNIDKTKAQYIKVEAISIKTPPAWHHATGLPSWIFADEIIIK